MPYQIAVRPRSEPVKPRGRKRQELPDEVAAAVQSALNLTDMDTVIGPFESEEDAKKLWSVIRARLRDGSFGPDYVAHGGVASSTPRDGQSVAYAVIFNVAIRKPVTRKPRKAKEEATEATPVREPALV
jgi:hypothetical protein